MCEVIKNSSPSSPVVRGNSISWDHIGHDLILLHVPTWECITVSEDVQLPEMSLQGYCVHTFMTEDTGLGNNSVAHKSGPCPECGCGNMWL